MWRDPILILGMRVGIYSYCPIQTKLIANDNAVKIQMQVINAHRNIVDRQYRQSDRVTTHRKTIFIGLNAIKGEFS